MKCSFFQPPEFLALPIFGLSISPTSIKISKFKQSKIGYIPDVITEVPVATTCSFFSDTGPYPECADLKNIFKDLKKKYKIQFVQLSIPEESTYVFKISIPTNSIELIDEFIVNNIEQYVPLAATDVFFDYKLLKSHATDSLTAVIVTAIPRTVVEKYAHFLESCDIFMIACEPETHAIARCVIDRKDMNPCIIINIGQYSTNISIVEEGIVQYSQSLAVKSENISENMSPETALIFKENIKKVIIYWFTSKEQNSQNSKIENIILTGDNIESSDIINFLESNLFVNATFANVWKNCFDLKEYIPKISKTESLKYAATIGLSMSKIK